MKQVISWFDIPTLNFDRAVEFYQSVFDIKLNIVDCGKEIMGCFPNIDANVEGAIFYSPDYKPSAEGVCISFYTEIGVSQFLEKVIKHGGSILKPKTKLNIENRGYFALFTDTEGNRIGVYSNN